MLIVSTNAADAERALLAGDLVCPDCDGELRPWSHARPRTVRLLGATRTIRPRRSRCRSCAATHVLLPGCLLWRRVDDVHVIGAALTANARGHGHRRIAAELGRPADTVRGWLRAARARAEQTASHCVRLALHLNTRLWRIDPTVGARSRLDVALRALATAVTAAQHAHGKTARSPWEVAAAVCSGLLLANTNRPYPPLT